MAENHPKRVLPQLREPVVLENSESQENELKRLQNKNDQLVTNNKRLLDENRRHLKHNRVLQAKYDRKCRENIVLKERVTNMQITIDGHEKREGKMYEVLKSKNQQTTFNISGNLAVSQETSELPDSPPPMYTPPTETPAAVATEAPAAITHTGSPHGVTFVERLKAILRTAATKNGQTIESRPKGHVSSYTYFINAECFCKAMDVLQAEHANKLSDFLGGNLHNTQVTKICCFIGHVIRMNIINATNLQISDVLFAFEDYYPSRLTVQKKLSDCSSTPEQQLLLGTFEGLLKRFLP